MYLSKYAAKNIFFCFVIFLSSCFTNPLNSQKNWNKDELDKTTKIRYTTDLHGKDLMREMLNQIVDMRFIVDTSSLNPMKTLPKTVGTVEMRFRVDFNDSTFTVSGQLAYPNNDFLHPNASLDWQDIRKGDKGPGSGRGYEVLKLFGDRIPYINVQYSK